MKMFKAVCRYTLDDVKKNEVVDISIKMKDSFLSYAVIKEGMLVLVLNAIEFHKHFDLIDSELSSYASVIEEAILDDHESVAEEVDYYSDNFVLGFDIVDAIQSVVNRIQNKCFVDESEDGDLQFIVSCLYEEDKDGELSSNKIILTIKHHRNTNSRVLFPSGSMYGFDYLADVMRGMYNQTM